MFVARRARRRALVTGMVVGGAIASRRNGGSGSSGSSRSPSPPKHHHAPPPPAHPSTSAYAGAPPPAGYNAPPPAGYPPPAQHGYAAPAPAGYPPPAPHHGAPPPVAAAPPAGYPPPAHYGAPPAAPMPAPAPAFPAAAGDPFGDSHFGAPAPAAAPPPVEQARPVGSVDAWHAVLLLKERGILYEDQYLQIGLASSYTRGSGSIVLFLGNKSPTAPITGLLLALTPAAGVQVSVGAVPPSLAPKQQAQVMLALRCTAPFRAPPALALSYALGGSPALPAPGALLRLPVAMHKFMAPEPRIAKELFFEHWRNAPAHCKAHDAVDRGAAGPLGSEAIQAAMRALHLGVEHGYLDPSPNNEAGAAYWACGATDAEAAAAPRVCCCRVEVNPANRAQFHVTVLSQVPELAVEVHEALVAHLKALPSSA